MTPDLTTEERAAVRALKRLARKWPRSLWLFSASGSLHVMKCGPGGERGAAAPGRETYAYGKEVYDPRRSVGTIGIPNDGGDW